MCFFITVLVKGGEAGAIEQVFERHGLRAVSIRNESVAASIGQDFLQFRTGSYCDCDSALAPSSKPARGSDHDQTDDLERKGWSKAKIARWVQDRQKAGQRAANKPRNSMGFDGWASLTTELISQGGAVEAGLLVHFYSGDVSREVFAPRRKLIPAAEFREKLVSIVEDEALIVSGRRGVR